MTPQYRRLCLLTQQSDRKIKKLLDRGRIVVDRETGLVYVPTSLTPEKPVGAPTKRGYLRTCIKTGKKNLVVMVHRIVWISLHGVPRLGKKINHEDGVKTNNKPFNLKLTDNAGNNAHAVKTGLWKPNYGLKNGWAKLSDQQVRAIVRRKKKGESAVKLSEEFGISQTHVRRVANGSRKVPVSSRT